MLGNHLTRSGGSRVLETLERRAMFAVSPVAVEPGYAVAPATESTTAPITIDHDLVGNWSGALLSDGVKVGRLSIQIKEVGLDGNVAVELSIAGDRQEPLSASGVGMYVREKAVLEVTFGDSREFFGTLTADARPWKGVIDASVTYVAGGEKQSATATLSRDDGTAFRAAAVEENHRLDSVFSDVLL